MNIAVYLRNRGLKGDARIERLKRRLASGGCGLVDICSRSDLEGRDVGMLVSIGGDGTFLSAAALVGESGIPVLGMNLGRLGFLSENGPDQVADAILSGAYSVEDRTLLSAKPSFMTGNPSVDGWPFALNEVTVHRIGAAMLGVDVDILGRRAHCGHQLGVDSIFPERRRADCASRGTGAHHFPDITAQSQRPSADCPGYCRNQHQTAFQGFFGHVHA